MVIDKYKIWFIALPMKNDKKIAIKNKVKSYLDIYENREILFKNQRNLKNYLKFL